MFFFVHACAFGANAADRNSLIGQPLVGIVGTQLQSILRARREHAIRFAYAARDEIVDHHTEIRLRAIDDGFVALACQSPPR